jgi:hypothetical protein
MAVIPIKAALARKLAKAASASCRSGYIIAFHYRTNLVLLKDRKGTAMKTILLALALLAPSLEALASEPQTGKCYPSYPFEYVIRARLAPGKYHVWSPSLGHGIVKTKVRLEERGYGFINLPIKKVGSKDLPLENGFTAKARVWEDCVMKEEKIVLPRQFGQPYGSGQWTIK